MSFIGSPVTIQNTDSGEWVVRIENVASTTRGESVSIAVALRRDPYATLPDIQSRAVARAIELLQEWKAAQA